MDAKKRKLLENAYQKYLDLAFNNRSLIDMDQYISADITGYGAALDEKVLSFPSFTAMVKRQQEQMNSEEIKMDLEIIPILRKTSATEQTAIYVDEYKIILHNEGQSIPMFLRNSIVFQYQEEFWKIVHWHCSKPNYTLGVEDPLHLKEWQQEKIKLEKLVAEKTADLAHKNQELALEAALERVRTRTMAMQNSSELTEAASVLFQQLQLLGGNITATGIGLCQIDNPVGEFWMGSTSELDLESIAIRHDIDPTHQNIFEAWKKQEVLYIEERTDKELAQHYQNIMKLPSFKAKMDLAQKAGYQIPTRQLWHTANFKYGFLLITTTEPYQHANLLPRFAQVFEQTYTRFLDLKRVEIQAKQAQIESALERVRSRTMAMHRSEDLKEVVKAMYQEMVPFGFDAFSCTIHLFHKEAQNIEVWMEDLSGAKHLQSYFWYGREHPLINEMWEAWEQKEPQMVVHLKDEEKKNVDDYLFEKTDYSQFPEVVKKQIRSVQEVYHIPTFFKDGFLSMTNFKVPSNFQKDILKRFAKVFEQTYIRFLDLQKVEAQAKEAQIEVALERVRARTMAMHKSEEFSQVASVMFKEFHQLDLINEIARIVININDEENGDCLMWLTGLGGEEISTRFAYNYLDNELWEAEYRTYQQVAKDKRKEHKYIVTHEGKAWEELLAFSHEKGILTPAEVKKINDQGIQKWIEHIVWFAYGSLVIGRESPLSEDGFNILQRFTAVFEQTYTRFLDLQKAEKQAQAIEKIFNENQRLLHSILPKPIAEQIRQGQQTVVKRFEEVSILFADIVGFTILSEKLSPQKVVDILNGLFSKFDDLTDKYGLEKIKTIGDAYMVASGVPEEKDNHALILFQFAQEMLEAIQTFNQVHNLTLEIRIGISSGPVVAGVIGKKKFAYDLWGDTVNTAARMEAYGQASCIQLAPPSYEFLKDDFVFEKIPNVEIKGKGMMDVYLWMP